MEEGFVDIALLKNSESFKNTDFRFIYDNVDINANLVDLVNAKIAQNDNYFKQFTIDSSPIQLKYFYMDIMRMQELKPHHMIVLCTACVNMLFTLKLIWLGITKPLSPTRFLIIDLLSNGNNILEFIAQVRLHISNFFFKISNSMESSSLGIKKGANDCAKRTGTIRAF
jgi:hypothetical protein